MPKYQQQQCYFCSKNMQRINFRNIQLIQKYVSSQHKIIDPQHTGVCSAHQRKLAKAVKRARRMALLPHRGQ